MLGLLVLAGHHDAQVLTVLWFVGDTHSRIRRVDALPTWPGGTKDVDTQVGWIDVHFDLFGFWHNGDGHSRSVDTPLGFGDGYTLHTVRTAFKFELAVNVPALDRGNN